MLRNIFRTGFCVLSFVFATSPVHSQDLNVTYQAPEIETARVNSNGQRHDKESTTPFTAPDGYYFNELTFTTRIVKDEDSSDRECRKEFGDYTEIVPGITVPRKLFLHSRVVSVGGIFNVGKSGRLICATDGKASSFAAITEEEFAASATTNTVVSVASLPADISLESQGRSLIEISVPLDRLTFELKEVIGKEHSLPAGFSARVLNAHFDRYVNGGNQLAFYTDLDISGPIGARCEIWVNFSIPAARFRDLGIADNGPRSDCRSGSLLGQLADLPTKLGIAIREQISKSLSEALLGSGGSIDDWAADDPELAQFLSKGLAQGSYCNWRSKEALCIRIGWPSRTAIADRELNLLRSAPAPEGPIDQASVKSKLEKFMQIGQQSHMATAANGTRFPSGFMTDGAVEDGDMALFGGLLCLSGQEIGCQTLRNSFTPDGRFWRSPRRVGEPDTPEHSTLSGDQLKGVLAFLITKGDKADLVRFLNYVSAQNTVIPDGSAVLESGYSTCPNRFPNFTCLVSGSDWISLKLLSNKLGAKAHLPPDIDDIIRRSGASSNVTRWESQLQNNGYRLHLIAVQLHLMKTLGIENDDLKSARGILAAREPNNAYFQYLNLGADKRVQSLADSRCILPVQHGDFSDWQWQRAENSKAWERSMIWDCVFIYSLLSN